MLAAISSTASGACRNPLTPSSITSGTPPTRAATTGTAQAGPATEQAFSCDESRTEGTCSDYSGLWEPERRAAWEFICATYGGIVLTAGTSCPTAGRTGTCRVPIGAPTRIEEVRHYDAATAAADEAACSPFTWTDG